MNPRIREVGFLALGVAALLETAIYHHSWPLSWLVLALGGYLAIDAMAWGLLESRVRGEKTAQQQLHALGNFMESFWRLDFAALLSATVALGLAVHAMRVVGENQSTSAAGSLEKAKHLLGFAAASLATTFALTIWYWGLLRKKRASFEGLLKRATEIWGSRAARPASIQRLFGLFTVVALVLAVLTCFDCVSDDVWRGTAIGALTALDLGYLLLLAATRRKRRDPGKQQDKH